RIQDKNGGNGDGILIIAQGRGSKRGQHEHPDHERSKLSPENRPPPFDLAIVDFIGTAFGQSQRGLSLTQPSFRIRAELDGSLFHIAELGRRDVLTSDLSSVRWHLTSGTHI